MRRFSFGPSLVLKGRKFKGLRGYAGKPFHPPLTAALYRIHLDLASLNEVQWFADGPAVVRSMKDTGHLST